MGSKASGKKVDEKATPLGDRVYPKHRKMLKAIAKKRGVKNAAAIRVVIEEAYAGIKTV